MQLQTVKVTIKENRDVEIQVEGMEGTTCLDLTADLEKALGGDIVSRTMTADSFQEVEGTEKLSVQG